MSGEALPFSNCSRTFIVGEYKIMLSELGVANSLSEELVKIIQNSAPAVLEHLKKELRTRNPI